MHCRFKITFHLWLLLSWSASFGQVQDRTIAPADGDTIMATSTAESMQETEVEQPVRYHDITPSVQQWNAIISDPSFHYRDKREYVPKKEIRHEKLPALLLILMAIYKFLISAVGKLILLGLLVVIVGYVIYRILTGEGRRLFGKQSKQLNEGGEEVVNEEDLLTTNWEAQLQDALVSGDTRKAIRYSYLILLQTLQAQNLIHYRQDKTNAAYYRELSGSDYRQPFRQLSRQYEAAWYGSFLPSEQGLTEYMNLFNEIRKKTGHR